MLSIARQRCSTYLSSNASPKSGPKVPQLEFNDDALHPSNFPQVASLEGKAEDLVLSTLVLEHLPLDSFFQAVKSVLRKSGAAYLVLTNMHAEMGRKGQAGFVDEEKGIKVRGESYNYEIDEVLGEGRKWGFTLEGQVGERSVQAADVGSDGSIGLLGERGKKWIGIKVWFGFIMKLVGDS